MARAGAGPGGGIMAGQGIRGVLQFNTPSPLEAYNFVLDQLKLTNTGVAK